MSSRPVIPDVVDPNFPKIYLSDQLISFISPTVGVPDESSRVRGKTTTEMETT